MKIIKLASIDSTNKLARSYEPNSVLVASEQTAGVGRFDRAWSSGLGGLWFSIVYNCDRTPTQYTFIASLAVLDVIGIGDIKWPNDIFVNGKKICGILSESIYSGEKCLKVIIGIGLNVSNKLPTELNEVGIRLVDVKSGKYDLDKLLEDIINKFEEYCKMDFNDILALYKEKCFMLGKNVTVKKIDEEISGVAVDIDSDGNLILETDSGSVVVEEGDVTF